MVTENRWLLNTGLIGIKCTERKLKLWSYNTIYCIIEGVTKASLSVGLKEESRLDMSYDLI